MPRRTIAATFDAVDGPFLKAMRRMDQSIGRFETSTVAGLGRVEMGMNRINATAMRISLTATTALTSILGAFGGRYLADFLNSAQNIENALKTIGRDGQVNFDLMVQASLRSRTGLEQFTEAVVRNQKALGDKATFREVLEITEAVAKGLAASGKSAQESASTVLQLSQALQKGRLDGEELRSLSENAPVELLDEIAKAAGGARGELKQLGADGQLTTDVLLKALQAFAGQADAILNKTDLTISQAMTNLRTGITVALKGFDEASGASETFTQAMDALARTLAGSTEAAIAFGEAVKVAIPLLAARGIAGAANTSVTALGRYTQGLQNAAKATKLEQEAAREGLATAQARLVKRQAEMAAMNAQTVSSRKLAKAKKSLAFAQLQVERQSARVTASHLAAAAAENNLRFSTQALAFAQRGLHGVFALMGGPIGAIALGATALVLAYQKLDYAAQAAKASQEALAAQSAVEQSIQRVQDATNSIAKLEEDLEKARQAADGNQSKRHKDEVARIKERITQGKAELEVELRRLRLEQGDRDAKLRNAQAAFDQAAEHQVFGGLTEYQARQSVDPNDPRTFEQIRAQLLEQLNAKLRANVDLTEQEVELAKQLNEIERLRIERGNSQRDIDSLTELTGPSGALIIPKGATTPSASFSDALEGYDKAFRKIEELKAKRAELEQGLAGATGAQADAIIRALFSLDAELVKLEKANTWLAQLEGRARTLSTQADVVLTKLADPNLSPENAAALSQQLETTQQRLSEINSTIAEGKITLLGDDISEAAQRLAELNETFEATGFDEDNQVRDAVEAAEMALNDARNAGEQLSQTHMDGIEAALGRVEAQALRAAGAIAQAFRAAWQEALSAEQKAAAVEEEASIREKLGSNEREIQARLAEARVRREIIGAGNGELSHQQDAQLTEAMKTRREIAERIYDAETRITAERKRQTELAKVRSGGGGRKRGGGSRAETITDAEKEALRFIQSQLTTTERQRLELERILAVRGQLVQVYGEEHQKVTDLDEALDRAGRNAREGFGQAIVDMFAEGIRAGDSLGDTVKKLIAHFIELNGVAAVQNLFAGKHKVSTGGIIGGLIGDIFGFATGGIMTGKGPAPLPTRAYATGGIANSPQLALFGEGAQPEAFVPLPDGKTIPVTITGHDVQRWAQGRHELQSNSVVLDASMNVQIDGTGKSTEEMKAEMLPMFEQQQRVIIQQVQELNREDPNFIV